MQQWLVMNKKADFKAIGEKFKIDQVTARILRNREIVEDEDIRSFLYGGMEDLYNPHLLKDGEKLEDVMSIAKAFVPNEYNSNTENFIKKLKETIG